jgi:hypothetical protein
MFSICSRMRFILRTQAQQSKIHGEVAFSDAPDDYAVVIDGPVVGRIYRYPHGPSMGKWGWFLQSPTGATGYADTLDDAKEKLKQRWFIETKKLSQH